MLTDHTDHRRHEQHHAIGRDGLLEFLDSLALGFHQPPPLLHHPMHFVPRLIVLLGGENVAERLECQGRPIRGVVGPAGFRPVVFGHRLLRGVPRRPGLAGIDAGEEIGQPGIGQGDLFAERGQVGVGEGFLIPAHEAGRQVLGVAAVRRLRQGDPPRDDTPMNLADITASYRTSSAPLTARLALGRALHPLVLP